MPARAALHVKGYVMTLPPVGNDASARHSAIGSRGACPVMRNRHFALFSFPGRGYASPRRAASCKL
jgi:hypothetical protein